MRKVELVISVVFLMVGMPFSLCYAVERAPRISDREIIESLAELKAGQKLIQQRFDQIDQRFQQVDQRFQQVDQRLDRMVGLFLGIVGAFAAIVASTIGFAIWDRRMTLKPALERSDALSARGEQMERVLREYARVEPRLAEIMESVGMR